MAPAAAGCCSSGVARQFAPALKAVSSLGEFTGVHLQVYRSPRRRGDLAKRQEGEVFGEWILQSATT